MSSEIETQEKSKHFINPISIKKKRRYQSFYYTRCIMRSSNYICVNQLSEI